MADDAKIKPQIDGWVYDRPPPPNGDARKLVTLVQGGMTWVGIRAFNYTTGSWMNNNEPTNETVKCWRDLPEPSDAFYDRGILNVRKDKESPWHFCEVPNG